MHFGPKWHPFWKGWGVILATKWHQVRQKIDSQINQKNDHLLDGLKIEFCWILAPKLVPKRRNRSLHFRSFLALGALLAPRPPQDPLKTHPRSLLGAIWDDLGALLAPRSPKTRPQETSWERFWTICASNLVDFEWISEPTRSIFG